MTTSAVLIVSAVFMASSSVICLRYTHAYPHRLSYGKHRCLYYLHYHIFVSIHLPPFSHAATATSLNSSSTTTLPRSTCHSHSIFSTHDGSSGAKASGPNIQRRKGATGRLAAVKSDLMRRLKYGFASGFRDWLAARSGSSKQSTTAGPSSADPQFSRRRSLNGSRSSLSSEVSQLVAGAVVMECWEQWPASSLTGM